MNMEINYSIRIVKVLVDSGAYTSLMIAGDFNNRHITWNHGIWKFRGREKDAS